jgi:hypothetical protein
VNREDHVSLNNYRGRSPQRSQDDRDALPDAERHEGRLVAALADHAGDRHHGERGAGATRDPLPLTVVNGDSVAGEGEPVCDVRADAVGPAPLVSVLFVAFDRRAGRPVISLMLGRREHQHAGEKEEQPHEHGTARPHRQPDDAIRRLLGRGECRECNV